MKDIGIRELKARASEIVRQAAEERATYAITCRGRPVGVLAPARFDLPSAEPGPGEAWSRWERLADRIGATRAKRASALRELAPMRR